jgi:hypothetical protein
MELDDKIFKRSNDTIAKALEGGNHLSREQLQSSLEKKKITADGIRLVCLMMYAELEGIICSGPRHGNQFTYALLEERVPATKSLLQEEAVTELIHRYFGSRGPATLQDFVYWSGLTMKDAKTGFENVKHNFQEEKIEGAVYVHSTDTPKNKKQILRSFLMPDYDEYGMSYKNRDALFPPDKIVKEINDRNIIFNRMLIIDGIIKGSWKRTIKKDLVEIEIQSISKFTSNDLEKTETAARELGKFLGKKANVTINPIQ